METLLRTWRLAVVLLAIAPAALAGTVPATRFARVDTDACERPRALQMAIVRYVPADGRGDVTVDLISAVHIGDRSYYAELNQRFENYDALLFELVAAEEALPAAKVARRGGLLSGAQVGLTRLLGLSFQLDEIDYDRPNFVHADLTPEQLRQSMADRNESLYVYFWRVFFASVNEYAKDPLGVRDMMTIGSVLESREEQPLKTLFAYEMTDLGAARDILGEDSDSAIIGARNERAMEVLREQLGAGTKHIGVFYGVAHMPDLEARLVDELGFVYSGTTWIDAWQLGAP
jgi:hypothetical protein